MGGGHVSRPDFGMPQPDPAHPLTEFYCLLQRALDREGVFALPSLYAQFRAPARRIYADEAADFLTLLPDEEEGASEGETRVFRNLRDLEPAEAEEKSEEAPIHEFEEEEETIVEDWDFEPEEEEEEIKESNHLMIEAEDPAAGLAMALDSLKKIHRELGTKHPVAKISGANLSHRGIASVAERLAGGPGSDYGAFSVFIQYYTEPEVLFDVPPTCFLPAPKVTSAVVRMDIRPTPAVQVEDEEGYFALIRAAFGQRRKTAANAIAGGLNLPKEKVIAAIEASGFDARIRPEALTLSDFAKIQQALA